MCVSSLRSNFSINMSLQKPTHTDCSINWKGCLCHTGGISESLIPFTEITWNTFKNAAETRQDELLKQMQLYWNSGPRGFYHKSCYASYTHKHHIARIGLKRKSTSDKISSKSLQINESLQSGASTSNESQPSVPPKCSRLNTGTVDFLKCVICQQDKKCTKDRRRNERLSDCQTYQAGNKLRIAAEMKDDNKLFIILKDQDCIALEVRYHRSCYREYTRCVISEGSAHSSETIKTANEDQAYIVAYDKLFEEICLSVFEKKEIIIMSDLKDRYIELLSEHGVVKPTYRTEKLKAKLLNSFHDEIEFWQPKQRYHSELMFSSVIPKGALVEAMITLSSGDGKNDVFSDSVTCNDITTVYHCASILKQLLMGNTYQIPWPPTTSDICNDKASESIPTLFFNFLTWVTGYSTLNDDPNNVKIELSDKVLPKILSIGQDIVYCASGGKTKTPKHISLPMTIKNLTGSSQCVTLINKFGHGISLSQLQELEYAFAQTQLEEENICVPKGVVPNVFTTFCWDNNDIQEETLTGVGTTHCTNGILIQRQVQGCEPPPTNKKMQNFKSSKKRSVPIVLSRVEPYICKKRCGPNRAIPIDSQLLKKEDETHSQSSRKDFAWLLCRSCVNSETLFPEGEEPAVAEQRIQSWTGFNMIVKKEVPPLSNVGYCQVIDASPTELSTVYTILQNSVQMANQLNLNDVVIVVDQAIYAKALEVQWANAELFDRVVLRMGAFHISCTFLAVIGKRFGDGGLADMMVEADIVALGSISGVLEGRHYNRAVRAHKIVMEAMFRLQCIEFGTWFESQDRNMINEKAVIDQIENVKHDCSQENYHSLIESADFESVHSMYQTYVDSQTSPMFKYWNSYIELVQLLLRFIRSTREGDWNLHLSSIRDMMPWFFSYDRTNYARYIPWYWCEMKTLSENHPEAHAALQSGEFSVQRSKSNSFGQVAVDQTIEQTVNKDTKTKGGIIGFSLKKAAVQKWMATAHDRAAVTRCCKEMVGINEGEMKHKETCKARLCRDEKDVLNVINVIYSWTNPFESTDELFCLSSGVTANDEVTSDLLGAYDKGYVEAAKFVNQRIIKTDIKFLDRLPQMKLKTFSNFSASRKIKLPKEEVILKADRHLFARLLVVAQKRNLDLKDVLTHELGPIPWSLASPDGSLGKTMKSKMMDILEANTDTLMNVPPYSAWMIDAMAVMQAMSNIPPTFSDLAEVLLTNLINTSKEAKRIDFIGDQYPLISIKNAERSKRTTASGKLSVQIKAGSQYTPRQWKKFLSDGKNKTSLLEFLSVEWRSDKYKVLLSNCPIYITHGDYCTKIHVEENKVVSQEVPDLFSNQEEADTRLLLHSYHAASNGFRTVVIKSPDTDVEVLAIHHQNKIPSNILFLTGTKQRTRIVDISAIQRRIGSDVCEALPGLHAFTGCDSTSAFCGRGKKKAYDMITNNSTYCNAMKHVGNNLNVTETELTECEKFVCGIYGKQSSNNLNHTRYELFCSRNSQSQQLPPTSGALLQHMKRANFQCFIWKNALVPQVDLPCPNEHGWTVKDGMIDINWTEVKAAPNAVLELVNCKCKTTCTGRCSCKQMSLPCTDACKCTDLCCNKAETRMPSDSESDEND